MRILFLFFLTAAVVCAASAQTSTPARQWTSQDRKARVNLFYHLGSVVLPDGYKGAITANWNDAWGGYIESSDKSFEISWTAGTIQLPFEKHKEKFTWKDGDAGSKPAISLAEAKVESRDLIMARVGKWQIVFGAEIKSESDREVFMSIICSYLPERCPLCRSLPSEVRQ